MSMVSCLSWMTMIVFSVLQIILWLSLLVILGDQQLPNKAEFPNSKINFWLDCSLFPLNVDKAKFITFALSKKGLPACKTIKIHNSDCNNTEGVENCDCYEIERECRGSFPVVKCTYCRSEFQQSSKGNTSTICKKCEQNVKAYGKPTACEYCNIIAAFIGNKCQRCTNSEIKYGPPVNCEQCKQKCAFDRQDDDKKVDGKLLCWLCTLSFKRALAKTKQGDAERRAHLKMSGIHKKHKEKLRGHNKRPNRPDVTKMSIPDEQPLNKVARNNSAPGLVRVDLDPNSSDHVVAMTQLKEQIASLKKQITVKDGQLLSKDKMITELKAKHFTTENELRNKMKNSQKEHDDKIDVLNKRISGLLKQVAGLSKTANKRTSKGELTAGSDANNSSGTDSPSIP